LTDGAAEAAEIMAKKTMAFIIVESYVRYWYQLLVAM